LAKTWAILEEQIVILLDFSSFFFGKPIFVNIDFSFTSLTLLKLI